MKLSKQKRFEVWRDFMSHPDLGPDTPSCWLRERKHWRIAMKHEEPPEKLVALVIDLLQSLSPQAQMEVLAWTEKAEKKFKDQEIGGLNDVRSVR